MAERPARKAPKAHEAQVVRTERITPHMVRVVLGGEGLAGFAVGEFTDHYIKLLFAPEGVTLSGAVRHGPDPRGVPARAVARQPHLHGTELGPGPRAS